jgi:cytoskeletal protein RodZ
MARGNFGERLKRERELREVSPNEIVVATRISRRFLEALENEQWEKLPGGVFNRGFVRAIARFLGLDEENLLAEYDLARGDQAPEAAILNENRIPSPPKWMAALFVLGILLALAALAAAGVYGWKRYSARRRLQPTVTLSTQAPTGTLPASAVSGERPAATSNTVPLDLSVSTSSATHVRILTDGKVVFDAQMPAGDNRHFSGENAFEVTAADSSAVLLELNGQAMPPIGSPGASGTIVLSQKDLRPGNRGNAQR